MTSSYVSPNPAETLRRSGYRRLRRYRESISNDNDLNGDTASFEMYGFGDKDEVCNADIELKTRNRQLDPRSDESLLTFVEVVLKDGDSLANIALRYNCKVAELIRLNKLVRDQDFYGLKRIRVPVIRHGVLEELLQLEQKEMALYESAKDYDVHSSENQHLLNDDDHVESSQGQQATKFLLDVDRDIENILTTVKCTSSTDDVIQRPHINRQMNQSLNWRTALVLIVIVLIVIPVCFGIWLIIKHVLGIS